MIQDRIVVELRNRTQSERTPDESQTHTGEAKMLMRQWETLHEQKQILKQSGTERLQQFTRNQTAREAV